MNTNTAKISPEQFAQSYPELFFLYRELMLVTLETVDVRKALLTRESDDQVRMVQRTFEDEVAAAETKFRRSTDIYLAAHRDEAKSAGDELNATLARLLKEKDEASKLLNDAKQAELIRLQAQMLAAKECFRELKLFARVLTADGEFRDNQNRVSQDYDKALAPINSAYSDAVGRAFDKYNERLHRANSVCSELCEPHALDRKRAVRDATNKNHEQLLTARVERDDRSAVVRDLAKLFKDERMLELESFFNDPCEVTLRQYLTEAIAGMKELRDDWASTLDAEGN